MKKIVLLIKTFLVVALLGMGSMNVWADVVETEVVNCDFNNGETLFTGASRMTVDNDNNAKFICAYNSQNGYSLATYNFSEAIGSDAIAVKIEFAFWIPNVNAAYRRFFTVGQANLRTGFNKTAYSTAGSMFAFGLARNSSANYFSINGASTTAAASAANVLGAWAHAEIYVDHSKKTVNYKITSMDGNNTYYSANNVAFVDGTASYCNQLDFFDCQNDVVSYLDNLVITKYVDNSKVETTYTVKYQNASGADLKNPVVYNTYVGDIYSASASDMATFYNGDESKKYIYASGNNTSTTATSTASDNVITLVFNEYDKVAYTLTAKDGETTLGTLAEGNAYTDGSTTIYWSKFKNFNGQWYEQTTGSYGKTITEAGNTDIAFSPSNIAYFYEMESLTRSGGAYLTETSSSYSNNNRLRLSKGSTYYTPALDGGIYKLEIGCVNSNSSSNEVYVYTRSAEGVLSDKLHTHTATSGTTTLSYEITVPKGYSIAFNGNEGGSYNNNARMDYMTLKKLGEAVGLIGLNGNWATDILMTHGEGDVYTTTVDNFAAKAGINYEYKIRDYGTWSSFQFPAEGKGNKSFSVAEDGIYTLTFTADISTGAVTVESNKTGAYVNAKVVTFVNTAGWNENYVYAWAWTDEVGSNAEKWPGVEIEKVGTFQGYDVFAYSYENKYDKIIFNNGNSGDSNQTGNLTFTDGEQYSFGDILPYYTVTYTNPGNWTDVYAYTWTTKGGSDKNANWPGVQMTQTENGYVYGVHAATAPTKIIFNDNDSHQTDNLKFYDGLTYNFGVQGTPVLVTITDAGYATYASAATLNFDKSGITSYVATDEGNWVTFTEQSWVPAGTGILLKAEPGVYEIPTGTSEDEDYWVNSALVGVVKETTIEGPGIFVLMGTPEVGFYKTTANAFTVGANTAYLPADVQPSTRTFIGIDGNNTTGISERVSETTGEKCYYNLNGQRLTTPKKGLNIVNGQKFINK